MQVGDRIIQRVDTVWKLVFTPPPPGSSGDVVSISCEKLELWDHARWMRGLKDCPPRWVRFFVGMDEVWYYNRPTQQTGALQNHAAQ